MVENNEEEKSNKGKWDEFTCYYPVYFFGNIIRRAATQTRWSFGDLWLKDEYFESVEIGGWVQELMTVLKVGEMPQIKFKIPIVCLIKSMNEEQRETSLEILSDKEILKEIDGMFNQ